MMIETIAVNAASCRPRMVARTFQGITANPIRELALFTMLLDHAVSGFLPQGTPLWILLRVLGRLSMPVMCFFLAEGFFHTSNLRRYALRLLVFAAVSHLPYAFYFGADPLRETSVLWGLFLGLLSLAVWEADWPGWRKLPLLALLTILSLPADWGYISVAWVLSFGVFRGQKSRQMASFVLSGLALYILPVVPELVQSPQGWALYGYRFGFLLAIPLLLCYNGRRSPGNAAAKWAFYIFYPAHLALLTLLHAL